MCLQRRPLRLLAAVTALAALSTSCGGDSSGSSIEDLGSGDSPATTSDDPSTGDANLTGFVNGDVDELLNDAMFMVRAAGYFVDEDLDSGAGAGFNADIGPTGERILFGVVETGDGIVQWSIEFMSTETEPIDDLLDEAGFESGATAVVQIAESEWQVSGGCEGGASTFTGFHEAGSLSIGAGEDGEPVGNFSDTDEGITLIIPLAAPVSDYDFNTDGFSLSGTAEGFHYSVEVTCPG